MFMPLHQPLDLASTLLSGQTFRWRKEGPWFYGVAFGSVVKMRQEEAGIEFTSVPDDEHVLEPLLRDYLGLSADLESIYASIGIHARIVAAIERHSGMRILRQDPWECLVGFICSPASNIPRISNNVEDICSSFGQRVASSDHVRSTFPTPHELAEAGEQRLRQLGLGFRARPLAATARAIAEGALDLMALREAPYEQALNALTALDGVGDKVANCVLLFSLDKPHAFPVDVWVHRALKEWYLDGQGPGTGGRSHYLSKGKSISRINMRLWAQEYFGPYAGYANQYLFHDRRLQGRRGS